MRLIDADAMNEELFYKQLGGKNTLISAESAFNMVKAQPTTYDVERVVAELEEEKERYYKEFEKATDTSDVICYGNMSNVYGHAISIVRKGGME